MTPRQRVDVSAMWPGDRAPYLRQLVARLTATRDAILAAGPDAGLRRVAALDRAERTLRRAKGEAHRYGVRLDRDDIEVAQASLTDAQRHALTAALDDPVSCAALADACLSRHGAGGDTAPACDARARP